MVPFDAPIFMLPLSGMLFLIGAAFHQVAGIASEASSPGGWFLCTAMGIVIQAASVVILIQA